MRVKASDGGDLQNCPDGRMVLSSYGALKWPRQGAEEKGEVMFSRLARNILCSAITTVMISVTVLAQIPNYQNNINATGAWLANDSRLSDGSILFGQNSTEVQPYLGNLGAIGWTKDSTYHPDIQNWMNWYWAHVSWPDQWGIYRLY